MEKILSMFSVEDIVIFTCALFVAFKEVVSGIDWILSRVKKREDDLKAETTLENDDKDYREKIDKEMRDNKERIDKLSKSVELLTESDRESKRAYIIEKHHYFVYELGWIDDYSLDCINRSFDIYSRENGNSYVKGLMKEVRSLPNIPPDEVLKKYREVK